MKLLIFFFFLGGGGDEKEEEKVVCCTTSTGNVLRSTKEEYDQKEWTFHSYKLLHHHIHAGIPAEKMFQLFCFNEDIYSYFNTYKANS